MKIGFKTLTTNCKDSFSIILQFLDDREIVKEFMIANKEFNEIAWNCLHMKNMISTIECVIHSRDIVLFKRLLSHKQFKIEDYWISCVFVSIRAHNNDVFDLLMELNYEPKNPILDIAFLDYLESNNDVPEDPIQSRIFMWSSFLTASCFSKNSHAFRFIAKITMSIFDL